MRGIALGLLTALMIPSSVLAQDVVPDRRLVVTRDIDYVGTDLQTLFDTSIAACERVCLDNSDCIAFTYNTRNASCFPKSAVTDRAPYEGALSARVVTVDEETRARAALRQAELSFLRPGDFKNARDMLDVMPQRYESGQWSVRALLDAANQSKSAGKTKDALLWLGGAVVQEDSYALWKQYAAWSTEYSETSQSADKRQFRDRAFLASIHAYLRSDAPDDQVDALVVIAKALEQVRRGKDMLPALKLAETIKPRSDVTELLDDAIGKYGFRITNHEVEADSAAPRVCVTFNDPLQRTGVDYANYVRVPDQRLAVTTEEQRLCVSGLVHGGRYTVTFRSGLPSSKGDVLLRDIDITAYVRDRSPDVRFPGRSYVLPRSAEAGLPVETVNVTELELILRQVSDRNLIRSIKDNYFGRPLNFYEEQYFSNDIAEEVWRGTGKVENTINKDMLTRLPMGEAIGDLPAGIYALTAIVPGQRENSGKRATQWFILSDIGMTTMQGTDGLTVFARDLGDATPMAGLDVSLIGAANRVLGTAQTDADGVARFAPGLLRGTDGAAPALVMAQRGEQDLAFLSLTDPAFDLSDRGVEGRAPAGPLDTFLTTDRGAYRAGEVIHATALLRDAKANAVPDVPLIAVLTRPDGVEHSRHVSQNSADGGHVYELPLSPSVPRGTWRLAMYADPDAAALVSQTLLVEDFVPERIDFDLDLPEGVINPLKPPVLTVDARYLFGAPGAGLGIEGGVTLRTVTSLPEYPRYQFGRHDDRSEVRRATFPADLITDATGRAFLDLPIPEIDPQGRPMQARVSMGLTEASGRPVERSITRPVAPPTAMIGIRPAFDDVLPEQSQARFDVIALSPDLTPQDMNVTWRINKVRTRYQWYQQYGNWRWEPIVTRTVVARGDGVLGAEPLAISGNVDWGRYEVVVERADGAYIAASMGFSAGWYAPAEAGDTPDMLELSLDAESYRMGDTAQLRMVPRYAGKALVTVLADRVVSMQAIDVTEGENLLDLPVTDDWGAGVYVTAQVIRPMDVAAGQNPSRALGLAHAAVDPGDRKLTVSLDAPVEVAPRGPLTAAVQIDGLGQGDTAHVTVAAVDLGILNLTGFKSPDPSGHYFGQRRLGVEIRDIYGRLIDGMNGAMGQVRSGGDGAAGMRMQSPPPTEDLVAFFSGRVTVDANGVAEVSFDMPDFNGTVRLMAVAWSATGVGEAEADVLVRDPVVMTASLPRFLAPGDASRLLLELTHAKGPAGEMPLAITTEGVQLAPDAVPASVTLEDGGKVTLDLPLLADAVGDHSIQIALTTPDGAVLTKGLTLGVRANDPAVGATRRMTLDPGQSFVMDGEMFGGLRPQGATALVSAGPLARFDAPGLLASLDRYPYGCTEQVTSQALPLLYMSSVAEPLGLGNKAKIDLRIQQSVAKILTRQAANGAFGLWYAYSGDFWLDAYVTDFLSRARTAGYDIPDLAYQSAIDNLKNRIAYAPEFDKGGQDIAYALMVLAREGQAAMGDLRYYADEKASNFATPLALAQLGSALASYGDQPRADKMFALAAKRIAGIPANAERLYRADYGSTVRDAAGVLSLAVEARSDSIDRDALAARIAAVTRPLSTQEQAWALLAAHAMVKDPAVSGLAVDGEALAGPFVRRVDADALEEQTITNTSSLPTDLTLTTLGVPDGPTVKSGYGYALERAYFDMSGKPVEGDITAGDRMVVVLTVRPAEKTRARLMINDALPAGLEIDNPSLLRSGDIQALNWLKTTNAEHAEFRSDRFLAAVDQSGTDPVRLAYIVRAVSPGEFHHPAALVEDMYRPDYRATTASGRLSILP